VEGSAAGPGARPARGEDLFRGPARCVLGYLEAVRLAESFSLLEVRRAPRGTAVVRVRERWRQDGSPALGISSSEYLLARVGGEWKVVDRRTGARFQDREIADGYAAWFDVPAAAER
jgi:hypothetical protein